MAFYIYVNFLYIIPVIKNMKTIVLFLDAFRYNDMNENNCPYIYKLAKCGAYGPLKTLAGYHVEYSILSGYFPLKHNVWIWYYYDKGASCFKWIKPLKPMLVYLDGTLLRSFTRNFISYATMLIRYFQGKTRLLKANEIPIEKMDNFNISVDKFYTDKNSLNVPTLFDILRENKVRYMASEYPWIATNDCMKLAFFKRGDESNFKILNKNIEKYELLYCHVWNLDSLQHKYGTKSSESLMHIKKIDGFVKDLVESSKKNDNDLNVVIFSDHGMTNVIGTINAFNVLKDYEADYFIGSTTLQIWLNDLSKKNEIKQKFLKLNCLVYDEKNIGKIKIPYNRSFAGDMLVAARPGYQFYPDYFRKDANARAMHGYTTKNRDLDGIFIINGNAVKNKHIKHASLVDIMPTILKLIGIKNNDEYDGKAKI